MRMTITVLTLMSLALPAAAQTAGSGQSPGSQFQNMQASDAARLNQAVRNDPGARAALDQVEKRLSESGHKSGQLLEKTRP